MNWVSHSVQQCTYPGALDLKRAMLRLWQIMITLYEYSYYYPATVELTQKTEARYDCPQYSLLEKQTKSDLAWKTESRILNIQGWQEIYYYANIS